VNANATALTLQDIDSALSQFGYLRIGYPHDASTELDCRGLIYCSSGGIGRVGFTGPGATVPSGAPFPACCDPDGDGFGTLNGASFESGREGHPAGFFLAHHATTAQIGTGNLLIERATVGGVETQFPITLQDVFATVPALFSYDDGVRNAPTVSYPVAPSTRFPVAARPDGSIVLTLTLWRPQRRAIPGEPGVWTDLGGLTYSVPRIVNPELPGDQQFPGAGPCAGGVQDSARDRPASPANTVSYTLDVTRCLATAGLSWQPGHELQFFFDAGNGHDNVEQTVTFRRQ
jgi:hypothetical protein